MNELICGIDEAGRGPIAGPVTAASVILPADFPEDTVFDSKRCTPEQREKLVRYIISEAVDYAVGWAWPEEIDTVNIHFATLLAMTRSLSGLTAIPGRILVDGLYVPDMKIPSAAVVKGDSSIKEIMAASILAKTARDRWMVRYSWIDTRYKFEKHKGYPTAEHRNLCREFGISPIHRLSFTIL
jgi:ribonuclease HII